MISGLIGILVIIAGIEALIRGRVLSFLIGLVIIIVDPHRHLPCGDQYQSCHCRARWFWLPLPCCYRTSWAILAASVTDRLPNERSLLPRSPQSQDFPSVRRRKVAPYTAAWVRRCMPSLVSRPET